jgi:hypothetical protein
LRYLQESKARGVLRFPPPQRDCFGAICGTEELYDEDSYLLYVRAVTGKVVEKHSFRFPNLFYFGTSRNW